MNPPMVQVKNLEVRYRSGGRAFIAVNSVSLDIYEGKTVGLVGESGCGKSSVGKAIIGMTPKSKGSIYHFGEEVTHQNLLRLKNKWQMIFQNPYSALNPRMTIENILSEPLLVQRRYPKNQLRHIAEKLITSIQLPLSYLERRPRELSGGQRQRVNIARALALNPSFIFCDEPVSSLDSIHQREIVGLLQNLQNKLGISYLFVSHDLPLVCSISHRVAVMYFGEVVEWAAPDALIKQPSHPYTKALFSSVPAPDPKKERKRKKTILKGEVPSPFSPPSGCPFNNRCPYAQPICFSKAPSKLQVSKDHWVKCHFPL